MGTQRWQVPADAREAALKLVSLERALWVHRLSGASEAAVTLSVVERALAGGSLSGHRRAERLLRFARGLMRRLDAGSHGSEHWRAASQALGRELVAWDRSAARRLGDAADAAIEELLNEPLSAVYPLLAAARHRHRALRQDLVAAWMPRAVRAATAQGVLYQARIEQLVYVAVEALCKAVDTLDLEAQADLEEAAAQSIDRAVRRYLDSAPLPALSLVQPMSEGF